MRAVRYHEYGGPEVLQVDDVKRPAPGDGEVLIEVRAASVNPVDTKLREGLFGSLSLPAIPGGDAAGVVDAVGDGVETFATGDRVFLGGVGQLEVGTAAEYVCVSTEKVAHLPAGVSFDAGAAVPNVGATAWTALIDLAELRPTERCLVHGGSGGVGHVAVQLVDAVGATAITTAGSDAARERVIDLGADAALDYDSESLATDILAATDGSGIDVVLDHMLNEHLGVDFKVAADGGRVVTITGDVPPVSGGPLRNKELTVHGMSMGNRPERRSILRRLAELLERGDLDVVVADTYDLEKLDRAHRDVLDGGYVGKLVVRP